MEAIETIPAKVAEPGAVTVPAQTLHDIVRKLRTARRFPSSARSPNAG